ncbi:glycosyltransferase family 2 protein [Bacteroides fragilis]|uniref:glycosyltransferase family 2 protein n=1 Tax=Bacteroides fragilis TaxID=817 RepID=UPI000C772E71|nr:glycosyltransferase family 2 protein [Bacteroides fragilis]MCE8557297.1 glycosyltransferase family 2 protein [Bacteroides fragilis]
MKKWYNKYLPFFGKPLSELPEDAIGYVKGLLEQRQSDQPLVSVVLIAHNEECHLLSCLWSLVNNQTGSPIEILVINNLSTDRTEELLQKLGARYFNEVQKGPGHARQCGLEHAKGVYHLCIDADTMYPPYYIETHLKELQKPDVVCTYSLWSFIPDAAHSTWGLWMYETLRDIHLRIQAIKRPELCVRGMAFAFRTDLARRFGFRTDIRRGEDGSLALTLKPYGRLVFITNRKARVLTSNATLNTDGSLFNSFRIRFTKALNGFTSLFTKKKKYEDKESNLLNPQTKEERSKQNRITSKNSIT